MEKFIIHKEGIPYEVVHLEGSLYALDGKSYGPESYLIQGPNNPYAKAMTPEEYKNWISSQPLKPT